MFIAVKELELHKLQFSEDLGPGTVDFRTGEFRQVGALHVEGEAALVGSEIQIVGRLAIRVEMSCARCLEPVNRDIAAGFDLLYRPIGTMGAGTERELGDEDLDVGFYRGGGLFLADVVVEQVHLALPMKVVCREECQGLCPRCGANLNREHCRCGGKAMDPRLAPLAEWAARKKKS